MSGSQYKAVFTNKSWNGGNRRSEEVGQTQGGEGGDRGVGCPDTEPQQDVGDRNLRYLELSALLAGPGRPETVHVHLLGLGLQGGLVGHHRLDDGAVETGDHGEGSEVVDDVGKQDEGFRIPLLANNASSQTEQGSV